MLKRNYYTLGVICFLSTAILLCSGCNRQESQQSMNSVTTNSTASANATSSNSVETPGKEDVSAQESISATQKATQTTTQTAAQATPGTQTIPPETTMEEELTTTSQATPETTPEATSTVITVTELNKTMYANSAVNIRSGDSSEYSKIGSLKKGQKVTVTGQSKSTGWYRIDYDGKTGYVSNAYLQENQPETQTPHPTATPQKTPTPAPTQSKSTAEKLLNSVKLSPATSGFEPLDEIVKQVLGQITNSGMNTYQKVKACYDYLINTCSYGTNEALYDYIDAFFMGYMEEVRAYGMLKGHVGVCDDYSCAFAVLTRAIGLDCKVVGGQTRKSSGGYTGHAWCIVTINNVDYIFDPQIEDNIANGGQIKYYRFCKTYDEVPGAYIPD